MEREIKFRGKQVDNGEWFYGYYFFNGNEHVIVTNMGFTGKWVQVIPETLGQFTGLKDKKGVDVYEGYVISFDRKVSLYKNWPFTIVGVVHFGEGKYEVETKKVINKDFNNKSSIHFGVKVMEWIHLPEFHKSEVIGNIHESPELLGS